jgi:hypothetical protein
VVRRSFRAAARARRKSAKDAERSRRRTPPDLAEDSLHLVHPVLEYDEIQVFEAMGHEVFSLGFFIERSQMRTDTLRVPLEERIWHRECLGVFHATGCRTHVPDGVSYRYRPISVCYSI